MVIVMASRKCARFTVYCRSSNMRRSMTFLAAAGIALFLAAPLSFGQELTGDDYIQFMKPLEGSWTTTLKMDGDPVPGKLRYELAPNKHCYLTQMEGGGLPFINGIEGYDPVAKRWTGMGFADDREHSSSTVHAHRGTSCL
jgi:hypothetical protein